MDKNEIENKQSDMENKNIKLYNILSYIGILWIVSLFVKEKDNKTVRFHAGQGMLISIVSLIINVINNVVISNVFVTTDYFFDVQYTRVNGIGLLIEGLLNLAILALMIIGIINAANNKEQELPVIGQFAFYK